MCAIGGNAVIPTRTGADLQDIFAHQWSASNRGQYPKDVLVPSPQYTLPGHNGIETAFAKARNDNEHDQQPEK
ncbi:hypothetical protein ACN38_g12438 [Penicillium nordicum]|uniref:Uncharacterized protein n=1 Tax=Penicillium nordicum TaxID=229535 RepID=A0A0N0RXD9_9EURO|nr:hypothetical protein ACN38_g12438 [Penicillium nordicum]